MTRSNSSASALGALVLLVALGSADSAARAAISDYQYLSPVPASHLVRAQSNVIVRYGSPIKTSTVIQGRLTVTGSLSGPHPGVLALSDDGRTLIFAPTVPFVSNDSVSVHLNNGIKTTANVALPPLQFSFYVSPQAVTPVPARFDALASELPKVDWPATLHANPIAPSVSGCPLPAGLIPVSVLSSNQPEAGAVFLGPFSIAGGFGQTGTLAVVDDYGTPLFWRQLSGETALDFKIWPDGRLVYIGATHAYVMDSSFAVVDSFATGNGYSIDGHDAQLLPNGHVLLQSYDPQPVRMDSVVAGGSPNAIVQGLVVQELDLARRVVFQWRSWDHFAITDCNSQTVDWSSNNIDYVHGNSLELDHDGNLLISARHMSELTKIDHNTGAVLWRMGRNALRNQFAFPNDTRGYSHQHDFRRQPNGNVTLFDNGNFLSPQDSRGVEYQLDETTKTATQVWEYRSSPAVFGGFMGNVQRRSSGAQTLCWGGVFGSPLRISELHADGSVALELGLPDNTFSYRAYRYTPWQTTLIWADQPSLDFGSVVRHGLPVTMPVTVRNRAARSVTLDCAPATDAHFALATPLPVTIAPGSSVSLDVTFTPDDSIATWNGRLYLRSTGTSELVSGAIDVHATVHGATGVDATTPRAFAFQGARPNPVCAVTAFSFDLPRAGHATLEVFGVDGRKVATVASGALAPGHHELAWRAQGLAGGVYFARLAFQGNTATRRFVHVQ